MTLQLLKQARDKLKMFKMPADTKRAVWVAMTFLSIDSKKFDPQKTLLGADLKLVTVQTRGEAVETIRIKLKQPKTAWSQPTQIVELPTIGGWLCPVSAYKNWQRDRKGAVLGGTPVFTWKEGSLITLGDRNTMLAVLLDKEVSLGR